MCRLPPLVCPCIAHSTRLHRRRCNRGAHRGRCLVQSRGSGMGNNGGSRGGGTWPGHASSSTRSARPLPPGLPCASRGTAALAWRVSPVVTAPCLFQWPHTTATRSEESCEVNCDSLVILGPLWSWGDNAGRPACPGTATRHAGGPELLEALEGRLQRAASPQSLSSQQVGAVWVRGENRTPTAPGSCTTVGEFSEAHICVA